MAGFEVINGIRFKQEGIGSHRGRLTQIGPQFSIFAGRTKQGWAIRYWFAVYECECGNRIVQRCGFGGDSCGCILREQFATIMHLGHRLARKHGKSGSGTHKSWLCMRGRCCDPKNNEYHRYGARGIRVCDRWAKFENFYEDMGDRPDGCSLDRINCDGNYEPGNCRWATTKEQARNTRRNVRLTIDGATKTVTEWAEIAGIKPATIFGRLRSNKYSAKEAVFNPLRTRGDNPS